LRLFFALWPDDDVRRRLSQAARQLKFERHGRWVDPKNYHVTLAFIGETPATKRAVLQRIGSSLRVPKFTFLCDSIEFWQDSNVLVAVARETPPELLDLWCKLNDTLGLSRESLRAHVTLARKVTQAPVPQAMSPVAWRAMSFSLIRSDTGGAESAYTVVDTWSLLDERENR
jgi:2'-5' RNA ligase